MVDRTTRTGPAMVGPIPLSRHVPVRWYPSSLPTPGAPMLDRRARAGVEEGLRPFARTLGKTPISPDGLTLLGLVFSLGTFLFLAGGRPGWALATLVLSGVTDVLDGNVAKATGQQSKRGAFFD